MNHLEFYFRLWRKRVDELKSIRVYNEWCELNNERLEEEYFAQETGMEPELWCWSCRYSDCDRHPEKEICTANFAVQE